MVDASPPPLPPPDGECCASAREAARRQKAERVLSALQRRPSAMQRRPSTPFNAAATSGRSADEDGGPADVDLGKLAVLTTIYSLVEGAITYPYDLVKTRQQMAKPGSRISQMPTTVYVHYIIDKHGGASLYRGFSWNVLGGVPSEVAYYAVYTKAKQLMLQTNAGEQYPSAVYALAGLLSDVVGVLLWVPADIISQRMQMQGAEATSGGGGSSGGGSGGHHAGDGTCGGNTGRHGGGGIGVSSSGVSSRATAPYSGMASLRALSVDRSTIPSIAKPHASGFQLAYSICQQEGALGLWRGTFATMLSLAPNSAVWWLAHEEAKRRIARDLRCSEDETRVLGLSGALAGISSTVATNPLDVVKTRLQCSETPITLAAVVRGVMQEGGLRGFYSGLIPRLVAAIPRSICTVLAYERAIALCKKTPPA